MTSRWITASIVQASDGGQVVPGVTDNITLVGRVRMELNLQALPEQTLFDVGTVIATAGSKAAEAGLAIHHTSILVNFTED